MFFLPPVSRCTDGSLRSELRRHSGAEALTPEHFLPELLPDLRILFFDQTAAGAFIGIDKFTEFRLRMCTEHDMDMVLIVIPLFQGDMIFGRDIFKDFSCAIRDRIIQDLFSGTLRPGSDDNRVKNTECALLSSSLIFISLSFYFD